MLLLTLNIFINAFIIRAPTKTEELFIIVIQRPKKLHRQKTRMRKRKMSTEALVNEIVFNRGM